MENSLSEKCGVFGVYGQGLDVSRITYYGLSVLQHRGQESSGIAVSDGQIIDRHKDAGLVSRVYNERIIKSLQGHIGIGHNRYSTSGTKGLHHAQPFVENDIIAFAHNGNLPSVTALKTFLKENKIETGGCSDSELMAKALSFYLQQGMLVSHAVKNCYPLFTGAFSVVGMTKTELFAFRDPCGIRPLSVGKIEDGGYVIASETCALNIVNAQSIKDIKPGELVIVNSEGIKFYQMAFSNLKVDAFEFVYFARPDSVIHGRHVGTVRSNCGQILAKECPLDVDMVVPVPETAVQTALSYARALNLPAETAIVKNRYIHRTFIEPEQHTRELGVKMKLYPMPEIIKGKRVAIIDDSIVRGTTSRQLIKSFFDAGAKEVHMLISSPPVRFPDFYGINTPKISELIAVGKTVEQICDSIGANSLYFLSLEGLVEAIGLPADNLCLSCFNGEYPIRLRERAAEISSLKKAAI